MHLSGRSHKTIHRPNFHFIETRPAESLRPGACSIRLRQNHTRLLMTSFSYCFTIWIQLSPTGTFCLAQ